MRYVAQTKSFRRDLKRLIRGRYRDIIERELLEVVDILANDAPLDYSYHDHALTGNLLGYRECHLAFDLVLMYRLEGDNLLVLEKIGSHSEVLGL